MAPAGYIYHVLNRSNARVQIFSTTGDYLGFVQTLSEAVAQHAIDLFAYCVMPNHWHLVLRPNTEGALAGFMHFLTMAHTQRWHAFHGTTGSGHLYQGRYKSFPIEDDDHFLTVCRYVERNSVRASLVERAEQWRWSSCWSHLNEGANAAVRCTPWPVRFGAQYLDWVNTPLTGPELERVRSSVQRGSPFGSDAWSAAAVEKLGLLTTTRPRGRPRKF